MRPSRRTVELTEAERKRREEEFIGGASNVESGEGEGTNPSLIQTTQKPSQAESSEKHGKKLFNFMCDTRLMAALEQAANKQMKSKAAVITDALREHLKDFL